MAKYPHSSNGGITPPRNDIIEPTRLAGHVHHLLVTNSMKQRLLKLGGNSSPEFKVAIAANIAELDEVSNQLQQKITETSIGSK